MVAIRWWENIKVIPSNIDSLLTPVAFAYWLCGAGSFYKAKRAIAISTDSFRQEEVELLRSPILQNWNTLGLPRVSNGHGKNQYKIDIPKREVSKVQQLVKPHMPSSMRYRVGL